jgi:1,2-diacylglycerol 3-beta-glucosyltransferase
MQKVSILIAARNEANNILACLKAIDALSYPKSELQVLIGNDDSEDNTLSIVADFIADKPHFEVIDIASSISNLQGKTNVLAQLAHKATGDFLFFTDADIEVPPHWIENMLPHFKADIGVVTGITSMKSSDGVFAIFQGLEWLYYLSLMRLMSLFNVPITALGNNMAITKESYLNVGGYETIGFSLTEDFALFEAIVKYPYRFVQLFDSRVLNISKPVDSFKNLMIQRKRWMHGAMTLPFQHQLGIWTNALWLPFLLAMSFYSVKIALILAVIHYILVTSWVAGIINWLNICGVYFCLPLFWFYHTFNNFFMLLNYFIGKKTIWKGRTYQ